MLYCSYQVKETLQRLKLKAKTTLTPVPTLFNEELTTLRAGAWTDDSRALVEDMPTYHSSIVPDTPFSQPPLLLDVTSTSRMSTRRVPVDQ